MAEESQAKIPSLAEQYSLLKTEETKQDNVENTSLPEVKTSEEEKPAEVTAEEVAVTTGAAPEGGAEVATENTEEEKLSEAAQEAANPAAEVEDTATSETVAAVEEGDAEEVQPEIKIETAPADFRFPTTNQTRHCFTRYVEYHRCVAAKGEDAPECDKFAKYYRSLCPSEWVERWNEQRENGTFPGPL